MIEIRYVRKRIRLDTGEYITKRIAQYRSGFEKDIGGEDFRWEWNEWEEPEETDIIID